MNTQQAIAMLKMHKKAEQAFRQFGKDAQANQAKAKADQIIRDNPSVRRWLRDTALPQDQTERKTMEDFLG